MQFRIASLVLATAVVAAAQVPVVREGAYWVGNIGRFLFRSLRRRSR